MLSKREIQYRKAQREALQEAHFDANETIFLERELTQLRARIFEIQFPELMARKLMPFANDIAPSADTYSYKVLKPVGTAKFVGDKARDLPRVDVTATEVLGKVHPIGLSYGWDVNELREAARLQIPISELKARTAREATERAIDECLATGDLTTSSTQNGLQLSGLVNNADVVSNGIEAATFWVGGAITAANVLNDLNGMVSGIEKNSDSLFKANTLILPTAQYLYASQTPWSSLTGESILSVFKKNNENITLVLPWYRLNTAGAAGAPRMIAYQRDPMILEGVVPQEFEQLPPQAVGLELIIPCTARVGGVKIYQPAAFKYGDFATS